VGDEYFMAADGQATSVGGVCIYYLKATGSHSEAVTVQCEDFNNSVAASVVKCTGIADSPVDKSQKGTGTGTSPSSGATSTTVQAAELVVGAVGTMGPVADTAGSWAGSFAPGDAKNRVGAGGSGNGATVSDAFVVVATTGAMTASKSGITSREWGALVITFKGA
jgi:hypothetical protein